MLALALQLSAAITTTLEAGYYTKYLAPAFGVPLYDDEVYQSQITASIPWEHGIAGVAVWNSSSLNGVWDSGDETGLIVFGTYRLHSGFELRSSVAYFFLSDKEDTVRTTLGLFRTVDDWTFGVNAFSFAHDGPAGDRWVGHAILSRKFRISSDFSTSINSVLVYDTGNNFTSDGFLLRQGLSFEYQIYEGWALWADATVFVPLTIKNDVREDTDAVFSAGMRIKF